MEYSGFVPYKRIKNWFLLALFLLFYDLVTVNFSYLLALWLRFGRVFIQIPETYLRAWRQAVPLYSVLCLGVFAFVGLYQDRWCFLSFGNLLLLSSASVMTSVAHAALITVLYHRMPRSYYVLGLVLQFALVAGVRILVWLAVRLWLRYERSARRVRRTYADWEEEADEDLHFQPDHVNISRLSNVALHSEGTQGAEKTGESDDE